MKLRVNFNWKLALFVVLLLPILLRLGWWQLERAEEKRQMQAAHQARVLQGPVDYALLADDQWQNYQNVSVIGEFQPQQWLLDNQIYHGKFGYEVIQPFKVASGDTLLVSRGWVAGSLDRARLPAVDTPGGTVVIKGYLYRPADAYLLQEESAGSGWPRVVQAANVEKMYKALGETGKIARPLLLRLDDSDMHLLAAHWQIINVQPEKHTAYAMQWFGMALLLLILFIVASVKRESRTSGE